MSDRINEPEPYPVEEPDASVGDLVSRLTSDIGILVRDHIQLAKEEIKVEAKQAGAGAGLLGGGALAGWIAVMLLSMGLAWGIADATEPWIGFVVVGALWAIAAVVMAASGRKRLEKVDPVPRETMEEIQEDKLWLTEQTN
ncbi:MAG: phage holin family protein [Acidimicrobiia bacterium]